MNSQCKKTFTIFSIMMLIASANVSAERFKYIDLKSGDGIYINDGKIYVNNTGGNFNATTKQSVTYHMELKAGCGTSHRVKQAMIKYGIGAAVSTSNILEADNNYSVSINPGSDVKEMGYKSATMNIPVNKLDISPVEACQDLMNKKNGEGVSKMQFLASEHIINLPVPMIGLAYCSSTVNHSNGQWGFDHYNSNLTVICKKGSVSGIGGIKAKTNPIVGGDSIAAQNQVSKATLALAVVPSQQAMQCPANVKFTGTITSTAASTVKYRVLFPGSDKTGIRELKFKKAGTRSIGFINYTVKKSMPYATAVLEVISPNKIKSNYADFKVTCKSGQPGGIKSNSATPKLKFKSQSSAPKPRVIPSMINKNQGVEPDEIDRK